MLYPGCEGGGEEGKREEVTPPRGLLTIMPKLPIILFQCLQKFTSDV